MEKKIPRNQWQAVFVLILKIYTTRPMKFSLKVTLFYFRTVIKLLINEVLWLSVCFWVQFKVLVVTIKPYKAWDEDTWGIIFFQKSLPIQLGQIEWACCTSCQPKNIVSWGSGGEFFMVPILLAFHKALQIWLCSWVWVTTCTKGPASWLHC